MYEIRTADGYDEVLAVHETLTAAMFDTHHLAIATGAQLAANGEGHSGFRLALVVRETASGADVGFSVTAIAAPRRGD